jgi:hypothetical protein
MRNVVCSEALSTAALLGEAMTEFLPKIVVLELQGIALTIHSVQFKDARHGEMV